ncbi:hypothetical protein Goe16_01920 [Bacillus phage vB_BsuM-Goe16]|nr:hypothetical protein Goe16_01920 [Bacillus phage vB_BsuM-Goe16]
MGRGTYHDEMYERTVTAEEIQEKLRQEQEHKKYYESAIPELENLADMAKQESTKQLMNNTLRRAKADYNLYKKAVLDLTGLLNKVQNGEKVTYGQFLRAGTVTSKTFGELRGSL